MCCGVLQPCSGESACLPTKSRLQRVSTLLGMQEHLVVEECGCRHRPNRCYRQAHALQLYPGTPYETHLDVGTCSGRCESGEQTRWAEWPACWTRNKPPGQHFRENLSNFLSCISLPMPLCPLSISSFCLRSSCFGPCSFALFNPLCINTSVMCFYPSIHPSIHASVHLSVSICYLFIWLPV
jgi:hypothetical protein